MRVNKPQAVKILGAVSGTVLLLVAFQNCGQSLGQGFQIDSKAVQLNSRTGTPDLPGDDDGDDDDTSNDDLSTGDLCEDQLLAKFGSGYYVFLKNNCASCHNGEHEAPGFASKNMLSSYQVFKDKGYQLVSSNAVSNTHNPPATGPHNTGTIESLKAEWVSAQAAWLQCKGSDDTDKSVLTAAKANADIVNNKATSTYWGKISWNMGTASEMAAKNPTFPLSVNVEVQVAKIGANEVGYAIRNPTMSVTSGTAKYRVKGLFFYLNGKLFDSATVYRNINAVVCPGTPLNLAPVGNAQLIVTPGATPGTYLTAKTTDKFALQFTSIEKAAATDTCGTGSKEPPVVDDTPASVTFAQLTATSGNLNVLRVQCFSCHSGATIRGGVDLSKYASAKAAYMKILSRINDSGSPMPPTGIMSSSNRAIVEKWVTTGMPEK